VLNTRQAFARIAFALLPLAFGAAPALAASCDGPAHLAFDFWIGEWEVRGPAGRLAGINRIEKEYGGCVLHERYTTPGAYSGESLNVYDATRKVWRQTWVDTAGTLLLLEGDFRDGKMVLEGQTVGTDGQVVKHRITWTPATDGTLRQFWESRGATSEWRTVFDGHYTKKK
jgi:hypothetical protein